jgi:Winged helix DNA-binding domain
VATRLVDEDERRRRMARRHRLAPAQRGDDVAEIADDLVCLHSTDPVSVYLSAAVRMHLPSREAVEKALYEERSLIRHHAMRRTLWVMSTEVTRLAHASSTRRIAVTEHKRTLKFLADNSVAPDVAAWLDSAKVQVLDALHRLGPATAKRVGDELPELRVPLQLAPGKRYGTTVSAHTRVLLLLGFDGAVVRTRPVGTWINGQYRWALMSDWIDGGIGQPDELDERSAAAQLAGRWLRAFGPGTTEDLRWWTGWTLTSVRRALADVGAVEVQLAGGATGWLADDDLEPEDEIEPWVALLPALDPTTMGWKQREWYLRPADARLLFDTNGNGGPTVWADGRVVGGWVRRPDGTIAVRLLADVGRDQRNAVEAAAHSLEALVGDTHFTVSFPAPLQKELLV